MSPSLNNPRYITLSIALIIVAGLAALSSLPRLEDPHFANRAGIIVAPFPGASAERVEALVTDPLETAIREMAEVKHLTSNARPGVSAIVVELKDNVGEAETAQVWAELRDKISQLDSQLPAGAGPARLDTDRNYAYTWIAALRWRQPAKTDVLSLSRYGEELASRLRSVSGTDLVKLWGSAEEEVQVKVDSVKAAAVNLDVLRIAALIGGGDAKVSAGELSGDRHRQSIEISGGFDQLERVRQLPLLTLPEGGSLQLQDIAQVFRGEPETPTEMAFIDGRRGVTIAARMLPSYRGDQWTEQIREVAAELAANLPVEVELQELFVQERYTELRLRELVANIALGFCLIFLILLVTLGWRSAVVVALSLPLTMLFSLAVMNFAGVPIQQMSVTGLIVALGIMVDNAIVVADTVRRNRLEGYSPVAASGRALKHLWVPLLGSTLTTMLTFMPLALMPGPTGEFIGSIALAVMFSLAGSWLISLFIVAPIAGRWLSKDQQNGVAFPWGDALFRRSLGWVLLRPRRSLSVVGLLPLSGLLLSATLTEQFFPPADRDMINIEVYLPAASSIRRTQEATEELDSYIRGLPGVEALHWFAGRSAPPFYYNLRDNKDGSPQYAQAMLKTRDFAAANHLVASLQKELRDRFPGYQVLVRRLEQGPPVNAPVELRLYGSDISQLKQLGDEIRALALATEDVVQVRSSLGESVPKIWLNLDESAAQRSGVTLTELSRLLAASVDGVLSGSMLEATEQLPVRVSVQGLKGASVDLLMSLPLALETGPRPLSALAELEVRPVQALITRRDGRRVNMIDIHVRDGVLPAVVLDRVKAQLNAGKLEFPQGVSLEIGGDSEARNEAVSKLFGSLGIIFVLMLVTVLMAFNSFRLSALVFVVAFQAAGLGLFSLWAGGFPSGFTAIVGLMGLIGLAVNAAIVILSELGHSPMAMAGNRPEIVETVSGLTRHIGSTTLTTVAGLIPLIVSGGGFWPPFAVVLAGGTALTTLLSLYFVPAAFLVLRKPYVLQVLAERREVCRGPTVTATQQPAQD
jgi:multidrug efflux pump